MPFDLIVRTFPTHFSLALLQDCWSSYLLVLADREVHTRKVKHLERLCRRLLRLGEGTYYGGQQAHSYLLEIQFYGLLRSSSEIYLLQTGRSPQ